MKVFPIVDYETSYKGSKISNTAKIVNLNKQAYIEELKLNSVFSKFEEDFRATMQAFIYMVRK